VQAPAAAVSGPAPDAAAAAPANIPLLERAAAILDAPSAAPTTPDVTPATPTAPAIDAPALGAVGAIADQVDDVPSAAGSLLSTGTGRSVSMVVGLLVAIGLFLLLHRRADPGDGKLATARTGPDVARFR
jgi:hypothetical protein